MQQRQSNSAAAVIPIPFDYAGENLLRLVQKATQVIQQSLGNASSLEEVGKITFHISHELEEMQGSFIRFVDYAQFNKNQVDAIAKNTQELIYTLIDLCFFTQELILKGKRSRFTDLLFQEQKFVLNFVKELCNQLQKLDNSISYKIQKIAALKNKALSFYDGNKAKRILRSLAASRKKKFEKAIKLLSLLNGEFCFVGGTALNILEEKECHDVDVISTCQSHGHLLSLGFQKSNHITSLYTYRNDDMKIDLINLNVTKLDDECLLQNAKKRDYTICAFYMGKDGILKAPIRKSLADWQAKKLCIVVDNGHDNIVKRFSSDVVIMLRGLRYVVSGYTESPELVHALHKWNDKLTFHVKPIKQAHLKAVMRRYIFMLDDVQINFFMTLLDKYKLKSKLFGLHPEISFDAFKASMYKNNPQNSYASATVIMWQQIPVQLNVPVIYYGVKPGK